LRFDHYVQQLMPQYRFQRTASLQDCERLQIDYSLGRMRGNPPRLASRIPKRFHIGILADLNA
jgi:hypothetical protein